MLKTHVESVTTKTVVIFETVCRTMALGSTQPVTEMSTWNISWGVKPADA
jgi:hypothetical protein